MGDNNIYPNELGVFYKSSEKVKCLVCGKVVTGWNFGSPQKYEKVCVSFTSGSVCFKGWNETSSTNDK